MMLDFCTIATRNPKKDLLEVYPKFWIKKSKDLMVRGRDFYAVWNEDTKLWSTDEDTVSEIIDAELDKVAEEKRASFAGQVRVLYMRDSDSGSMGRFHAYVQKHMRDNYHPLDESLIFSNTETTKEDYASKKLPYALSDGDHQAWDELIGTLYSDSERDKLEWAIGAIVSGDSKTIQKFIVMYGEGGTGKSTVINIIEKLFHGYVATFDAKALGSNNAAFALEPFRTNPLVAIQHDGDLSRIEDNTRLNSVISHEMMTVNEKFKTTYTSNFNAFLFMGTNKPVKITDSKSGIIRRLIDVSPTGNTIPRRRYNKLVADINFELGAIAKHCLDSYKMDPGRYDVYIPSSMLSYSNDFYNFIVENYDIFKKNKDVTLPAVFKLYNEYCEESRVKYPYTKRVFIMELSNYFTSYDPKEKMFMGFKKNKFMTKPQTEPEPSWIILKEQPSLFDTEFAKCRAQLANSYGTPEKVWDNVKTVLSDIDTSKTHYCLMPLNLVVADFDIKNSNGEKDLTLNIMEASKWKPTYAEVSNSGQALHLHYYYIGNVEDLSHVFAPGIEIKTFSGKSALRRRLSLCNDIPIATITGGLPIKEKKMINFDAVKDEMHLRNLINKGLNKEVHPGTKPNVDFINKVLTDAYESGLQFDVTDIRPRVLQFAMGSTNQAKYCVDLVATMPFKSKENISESTVEYDDVYVFFDVEVFPNLCIVVYKPQGGKCVRLINPGPKDIEPLLKMKLIGYNCRRYDNHILYAIWRGFNNYELYLLSQRIIVEGSKNAFFGNAWNISFTDVFDFAATKQSLKKWEIELDGIAHHELGFPWDEPVPEDKWDLVADYCEDDVIATERVFEHLKNDFRGRLILADMTGKSANSTTNSLTQAHIFGSNTSPQDEFNYRNLALPVRWSKELERRYGEDYIFHIFDENGEPTYQIFDKNASMELPDGWSVLPFFPGYTFEAGVSTYMGDVIGEGGRVYAEPGVYGDVALLDVASMHPNSIISEVLFGPHYTKRFSDLVKNRILIKHKDFEHADPEYSKYLSDDVSPKDLAFALKIAINSVYGLTSAKFDNPFRDIRNVDNIVAKRGALFMTKLKAKVQEKGFTVVHIKTDSIKIADATPEIIEFVCRYGEEFGYTFEHEATYEKMCLVNDAVYVAKYKMGHECEAMYDYIPDDNGDHGGAWTATGTQFAVPYVFKTLFSREGIRFKDLCVTNAVTTSLYLDMNEDKYAALVAAHGFEDIFDRVLDDDRVKTLLKSVGIKKKEADALLADPDLHDYTFVGRVGSFCPIAPGRGGGLLLRAKKEGGYGAATGSKGFRWLEAENVKNSGKVGDVDLSYFNELVDNAIRAIETYCDSEWFRSDDPYIRGEVPYLMSDS